MKIIISILLVVILSSCSRVGTGELGIVLDWSKQVMEEPIVNSIEIHVLDSLYVIDASQIRVQVKDVKAKDIDGILFQDIDAQITYNVKKEGAVSFYKKTREIEILDGEYVLGVRLIEKESKNSLMKTFTKFKAGQVNTDKSEIENTMLKMLSDELNRKYPNAFEIVDINIDSAQLDTNVEKVLQSQALLDSEKRTMTSKGELQIKQSELLDNELVQMKNTAIKAGISISDLMKYKNDKERNRVLSELARNNQNTQLQIKE